MSFWKTTLLVMSSVGLYSVASASAEAANVRPGKKIFRDGKFWVIAHRGFSGRYPENTMLAFEKAAELPIDAIELDVHTSRDGKVVIMHDETLDRTTNRRGRISDLPWEELRKVDAGNNFDPDGNHTYPFRGRNVTIPLLEDVFKRFSDMKFIIEVKQVMPAMEEAVYRLIRQYRMEEKVIVASEHQEPLTCFRGLAPSIPTNFSGQEAKDFYKLYRLKMSQFYRSEGDALQIPPHYRGELVVDAQFVRASKKKGLTMHIWTVNDEQEMKRLMKAGVDGIISDFPDRLLQVVNEAKQIPQTI